MHLFVNIITDCGSRCSVCGVPARSKFGVLVALKILKRRKKYAKATRITCVVLLSYKGPLDNENGEAGAGKVLVRIREGEQFFDYFCVVTR